MNNEATARQPETRRHGSRLYDAVRIAVMLLAAVLSNGIVTVIAQYLWFRTSDLYGETMYIVRTSSDLEKALGTNIVGGWPFVSRSVYQGVGEVSARLPVHGAHGSGTIHLRAKNGGGSWEYQQLEARIEDAPPINLLPHPWSPRKLVLRGAGQLYFVRIGQSSSLDVDALARHYADKYQLDITLLSPVPYEVTSEYADEMVRVLKAAYPDLVSDPQAVIIAVTEIAMDWFSWRDDGRFAVVSIAGLTPEQFRRQVSKCLGLLWFELPYSAESRSVLYDNVGGSVDLEFMTDEF
jgi:Cytochrome oxidase complex assembly protein 1